MQQSPRPIYRPYQSSTNISVPAPRQCPLGADASRYTLPCTLFGGTLFGGTLFAAKTLFGGTLFAAKTLFGGTLFAAKTLFGGTLFADTSRSTLPCTLFAASP